MRPIAEVDEHRLVRKEGRVWLLAAKGEHHAILSSGGSIGGHGIQELVSVNTLVELLEDRS